MDRAYVDFERLFFLTLSSAFFVVRTKANVLLQRRYSHKIDKSTGVRSDHTVILTSFESASVYPDVLRRVTFLDVEKKKRFKFLTNNFTLPAFAMQALRVDPRFWRRLRKRSRLLKRLQRDVAVPDRTLPRALRLG
jgi:hypothetical protein